MLIRCWGTKSADLSVASIVVVRLQSEIYDGFKQSTQLGLATRTRRFLKLSPLHEDFINVTSISIVLIPTLHDPAKCFCLLLGVIGRISEGTRRLLKFLDTFNSILAFIELSPFDLVVILHSLGFLETVEKLL